MKKVLSLCIMGMFLFTAASAINNSENTSLTVTTASSNNSFGSLLDDYERIVKNIEDVYDLSKADTVTPEELIELQKTMQSSILEALDLQQKVKNVKSITPKQGLRVAKITKNLASLIKKINKDQKK